MKIRQNALEHARASAHIRYIFFVDTDNFITNPNTLRTLISREKGIVAPMLTIITVGFIVRAPPRVHKHIFNAFR